MKKISFTFLIIVISATSIFSKPPGTFKYQTMVRDNTGDIIANQPVSIRIGIISDSINGASIFSETHIVTTNQFGLVVIDIGRGTAETGIFEDIKWGESSHFLKLELDETAGTDYQFLGISELLSVPGPPFPEALHGKKMCGVIWNYTGPEDKAQEAFRPVREMKPDFEHVGPMPFPVLNSMFDVFYPKGLQWYWRADFIDQIPDEAVLKHAQYGKALPTPHSTMHLYPINGAAHKVANTDTPWAYRKANWSQVIVGVDPDPANKEKITKWTKDYYNAIHPHSSGGAYINFMMEEGQDRVKASYMHNYDRLVQVKKKYDPDNFFRVNQNISPNGH